MVLDFLRRLPIAPFLKGPESRPSTLRTLVRKLGARFPRDGSRHRYPPEGIALYKLQRNVPSLQFEKIQLQIKAQLKEISAKKLVYLTRTLKLLPDRFALAKGAPVSNSLLVVWNEMKYSKIVNPVVKGRNSCVAPPNLPHSVKRKSLIEIR